MAEGYPIDSAKIYKSFKVIFSGTGFGGTGLSPASVSCKDC